MPYIPRGTGLRRRNSTKHEENIELRIKSLEYCSGVLDKMGYKVQAQKDKDIIDNNDETMKQLWK